MKSTRRYESRSDANDWSYKCGQSDSTLEPTGYALEEGPSFLHEQVSMECALAQMTFSNAWFKCHGCGHKWQSRELDPSCPNCCRFYISNYPVKGEVSYREMHNSYARAGAQERDSQTD